MVVVREDQLSLAIGKEGQNARLAARLTSWKIDIKSQEEFDQLSQEEIDEILGLNEQTDKDLENIEENSKEDILEDENAQQGENLDIDKENIEDLSNDLDQIIKEDIEESDE